MTFDTMYDQRYERRKAKPLKECTECECDLYEGETVYIIGNKIFCEDCVVKTELEDLYK